MMVGVGVAVMEGSGGGSGILPWIFLFDIDSQVTQTGLNLAV